MPKKRNENREYLELIAQRPCMICNTRPVQVHHLLKPKDKKRGLGMRSGDEHVVPLCFKHHTELHTKWGDEFKFFEHYLGDKYAGQKQSALYNNCINDSWSESLF
tara:strand:+ start:95 stop:409 length:315 start_codon:yes stop_codon:yes gene_type:complete